MDRVGGYFTTLIPPNGWAEEKVFIGQEVPLADLTEGVRLARDLHYIGGRRLLRSGERLSERTISENRVLCSTR